MIMYRFTCNLAPKTHYSLDMDKVVDGEVVVRGGKLKLYVK